MTSETMRTIELEIKDMLTEINKIRNDESNEIGYHHKIEYQVRIIEKANKNIQSYMKRRI